MFLDFKLKLNCWLHVSHECAYKLEDDFNELFEHVELESISKDLSDDAKWLPELPQPMKIFRMWILYCLSMEEI